MTLNNFEVVSRALDYARLLHQRTGTAADIVLRLEEERAKVTRGQKKK